MLTVQLAFLLHEAVFHQGGVAMGTGEFLRVPRQTHGHEEGASGGRGGTRVTFLEDFSWHKRDGASVLLMLVVVLMEQLTYRMTFLHLLHTGVRVLAGMCSARCTMGLRSCG